MSDQPPAAGSVLFAKMAKIIGEIRSIPKSGHNDFHNYDYVTANDLINAVRDKLAAEGICVFTSVKSQEIREVVSKGEDRAGNEKEKRAILTLVTLEHTFACAESGETFVVLSQGQGSDVADKGGYKAITGAMKYFIYKCFMIPTDEDGSELDVGGGGGSSARPEPERRGAGGKPAAGQLDWRKVEIHFGVYKGQKLGELSDKALRAWFKWKPNPRYEKQEDRILLAAIQSAAKELGE